MVTFDSPEFEKMVEQDNQFLSKGKIDWEAKILPIANEIAECKKQLSISDIALKLYSEEHPEFSIEKHKADFGERLVRARTELANLIASISKKLMIGLKLLPTKLRIGKNENLLKKKKNGTTKSLMTISF